MPPQRGLADLHRGEKGVTWREWAEAPLGDKQPEGSKGWRGNARGRQAARGAKKHSTVCQRHGGGYTYRRMYT
eukprot:8885215-Karenia_brevis.AAC.1